MLATNLLLIYKVFALLSKELCILGPLRLLAFNSFLFEPNEGLFESLPSLPSFSVVHPPSVPFKGPGRDMVWLCCEVKLSLLVILI